MAGEKNLTELLKNMTPVLHEGAYVFVSVADPSAIDLGDAICTFREAEGTTLILPKEKADALHLPYDYVAAWITLMVHSSLEAVGLTAAFASELARHGISCNVVAAWYHDHIFVDQKDAHRALEVLRALAARARGIDG